MTMRKAKHLEPCSMRDLVMLQTIVRSQPHTPITHLDRPMYHKTQRCAYRPQYFTTNSRLAHWHSYSPPSSQIFIIKSSHYPTSHNTEYSYHLAVSAGEKNSVLNATPQRDNAQMRLNHFLLVYVYLIFFS